MGILDSLTKNPSLIALAALGIGLFIFRDKISGFFSGITGGAQTVSNLGETGNILSENLLGNLTGLQNITSGITDFFTTPIEFPKIEFPTVDLSGFTDFFTPSEIGTDITETPAAEGRASTRDRIVDTISSIIPTAENFNVQTDIEGQTFTGGGISFIGGSVTEIPIERLSLSQIIDQFGISASAASSLRAEAIGFTPEEQSFLNIGQELSPLGDLGVQTSGGFEGLTPEEIALRLTGGTITNF